MNTKVPDKLRFTIMKAGTFAETAFSLIIAALSAIRGPGHRPNASPQIFDGGFW